MMQFHKQLTLIAVLAASAIAPGAIAADGTKAAADGASGRVSRGVRDDADRAFLKGGGEGSIAKPRKLAGDPMIEKLCADLQPPRSLGAKKDQRERHLNALREVYEVVVPPGHFRVGEYRSRAGELPLDVNHSLSAADGALTLHVMQREGAAFEIPAEQAEELTEKIDDKQIALRVVFRIESEGAREISPCSTYPKSAVWGLRIVPLSYELLDASGKSIATAATPAKERFDRWVEPGAAVLRTWVQIEGGLEADALERAIEAKKGELEQCLAPVMSSAGLTGTLGYGATMAPSGALENVTLEVEAVEGAPEAASCVATVLASVTGPRSAKASRAHVSVNVDRDGESAAEVLQPPK